MLQQKRNKVSSMKKYMTLIALIFLIFSVKAQSFLQEVDSYVYSNCNVYKTIIQSDRYSFKVALAGSCDSLTIEQYITDYENYLIEYVSKLGIKKEQRILLEFYEKLGFQQVDFDKLKALTENLMGVKLIVSDQWKQGIEFKVIECL